MIKLTIEDKDGEIREVEIKEDVCLGLLASAYGNSTKIIKAETI